MLADVRQESWTRTARTACRPTRRCVRPRASATAASRRNPAAYTRDGSILPLALYEDGLTARTAIAHGRAGGAGAIFVNRFGHGRAVLLNILTSGYAGDGYNAIEGLRQQGRERTIRRTVERLLGDAGIRAPITLTTAAGPLAACSIARFRAGSTRYLAILPDYCVDRGKGIPTTIQLPRRYHLYDMRRGTYLGHASKITTVAETGIARLYALLPYRVSRIQVQGPARAERGVPLRLRFTCTASGATPGPHVFHVELTDPAGRRADWAFANLSAPGGDADFTILFAVNDPAGRWRLTVRDVATGMRSSRTILLPQATGNTVGHSEPTRHALRGSPGWTCRFCGAAFCSPVGSTAALPLGGRLLISKPRCLVSSLGHTSRSGEGVRGSISALGMGPSARSWKQRLGDAAEHKFQDDCKEQAQQVLGRKNGGAAKPQGQDAGR